MDHDKVAGLVRELLRELGEDPKREGLVNTPKRVAAALDFLASGYRTSPREILEKAIFVQETHNMVIARTSSCTACASTTCCRSSAVATSATSPRAVSWG